MMFWLHLCGYVVCLSLIVSTAIGLLSWWHYKADDRYVKRFRRQLDEFDTWLFSEASSEKVEEIE